MTLKSEANLQPNVALVLSGGAIKGIAHLGVLKALDDAGIRVDLIVGASIGAALGILYSDSQSAETSYQTISKIWPSHYSYNILGLPSIRNGIKGYGFFAIDGIRRALIKILKHTQLQDLPIPVRPVATQLNTGKLHVFSSGSMADIICASISIPGLFGPFVIGANYYVDGGIISDLPVKIARQLGAKIVIASNVALLAKNQDKMGNIWYRTWAIIQEKTRKEEEKKADILIQPDINTIPKLWTSHEELATLYEAGQKAAIAALPHIQKVIQKNHKTS